MPQDSEQDNGKPPNGPSESFESRFKAGADSAMKDILRWFGAEVRYMVSNTFYSLANITDDILQEALQKAWQKRDTYKSSEPFRSWFMQIARNTAIDHLRKNTSRPDLVPIDEALAIPATDIQSCDHAEMLYVRDACTLFDKMVKSLRPIDTRIMEEWMSRNGNGEWARKAAEATGLSETNVRQKQVRLRNSIASRMKKAGYELT